MALLTIEGRYENGQVTLSELPNGLEKARVVVTFLPSVNGSNGSAHTSVASTLANAEPISVAPDAEALAAAEAKEVERLEARERLLAFLNKGFDLGGGPYYTNRDEIYEERFARYK